MDITEQARRLDQVGFKRELLDRAVSLAGAQLLLYKELHDAVALRGFSPEEALRAVEDSRNQKN